MNYLKAFLIGVLVSITSCLCAQTNQTKIIGTWTFSKFDFLKPDSDSLDLIKDAEGITITFEKGDKYTTKKIIGDNVTDIESGIYSVSSDGKTIIQQGEQGEIVKLTDQELVMKVGDEIAIHLKKVSK